MSLFSHMHNVGFLMMWLNLTANFFTSCESLFHSISKLFSKLLMEPQHQKTINLHIYENKHAQTAQLISIFVFATGIVQFLFYLYSKFQALACFCECVGQFVSALVGNPNCWFSHVLAQFSCCLHNSNFTNKNFKVIVS